MMDTTMFFIALIIASVFWALLEIQIEGKYGWAGNLPTWRFDIMIKYIWNREITGYHVYIMGFIITMLHLPFLYVNWSLTLEIRIISFFLLLSFFEDFLWFILNPNFGLKKFNRESIPWHRTWFLALPEFYWLIFPAGIFLYTLSLYLPKLL